MRRIVIDCDRCGKKDISPVYAMYRPEGEGEEFLLDEAAKSDLMDELGYPWEEIGEVTFKLLPDLERLRGWVHFCDTCFTKMCQNMAQILNVKLKKQPHAKRKARAAEKAAEEAAEAAEQATDAAVPPAAEEPAPVEATPEEAPPEEPKAKAKPKAKSKGRKSTKKTTADSSAALPLA